ncbi:MAG: hypothetical protein PHC99_01520 [Methylococcales bacterium]|nr:hypothetical protein [Methylococcales bacterium]
MTKEVKEDMTNQAKRNSTTEQPKCGIIMPISACDSCTEQHWSEVKTIITDAVEEVGFTASLVSDADDVGIIQKRIIQNLYDNPIVVCDVSGKNPNVMFELGMRLAFDKLTIIIKDDKTSYSFDTSPIEHLEYPRDLRFSKIVDFKKSLGEKVKATISRASTDKNYTTFLKNFGKFAVAHLETKEMSKEDFIIEELQELRRVVLRRETMPMRLINSEIVESNRYKRLTSLIENNAMSFFRANNIDKNSISPVKLEQMLIHAIMSNDEIRILVNSLNEIEELVRTTVLKYLNSPLK